MSTDTQDAYCEGKKDERERIIKELGLKLRGGKTTLTVEYIWDVIGSNEDDPFVVPM